MINRRGFLGVLGAGLAAPAIVRASSLMPIKVPTSLVLPYTFSYYVKTPGDAEWVRHSKTIQILTVDGKPMIDYSDLKTRMVEYSFDGAQYWGTQLEWNHGH